MNRQYIPKFSNRSFVLVALIGLSILFLGMASAPVMGADLDDEDTYELEDGSQHWYGQILVLEDESIEEGDQIDFERDDGTVLTREANEPGRVVLDTRDFAESREGDGFFDSFVEVLDIEFALDRQELEENNFDPDRVGTDSETETTDTTFAIESDRLDPPYNVVIESDELTDSEIVSITDDTVTERVDGTPAVENIIDSEEVGFDFDGIEEGQYTFTFTVTDSSVEDGTVQRLSVDSTILVEDTTADVTGSATLEDTNEEIDLIIEDEEQTEVRTDTINSGDNFTFEDLEIGNYTLFVEADRHENQEQEFAITEDENNQEIDLGEFNLTLQDTLITAIVNIDPVDFGDTYPEEVEVIADGDQTALQSETFSDNGGDNEIEFEVQENDTISVTANDDFLIGDSGEVTAGEAGTNTEIRLEPEEIENGIIDLDVDSEGDPQEINVVAEQNNVEAFSETITGGEGTITERVETGEYTLTTSAVNHETDERDVFVNHSETSSESINLQLEEDEIEDDGTYYVGQQVNFSNIVETDDTVRFINEDTGNETDRTVDDGDNFRVEMETIEEDAGLGDYSVIVNQSEELQFFLDEESIDASFDTTIDLNADVQETTLSINSNRDADIEIDAIEIEMPDGTVVDGTDLANMSDRWNERNDISRAVHSGVDDFYEIDFRDSELDRMEGEYEFTFRTVETEAEDTTTLQVTADEDTDQTRPVDRNVFDGGRFWLGQFLGVDEPEIIQGESYDILQDGSVVREELTPRDLDGRVVFDTETLGTGEDYQIVRASDNQVIIEEFEIDEQNLDVEFEEDSLVSTGVETVTDFNLTSNRSNYSVAIRQVSGPEELRQSDLSSRINGARLSEVFIDGEDSNEVVINNVSGSDDYSIDLRNLEQGSYEFEFVVVDSTAEDTAGIEIVELEDGIPTFTEQFYEHGQGDIAGIEFEMGAGVETATIFIGDEDRTNYEAHIEITDADPNTATTGELQMDTTTAGQGEPEKTFTVQTIDEEEETDNGQTLSREVLREDEIPFDILAEARYLLRIEAEGVEHDISVLNHKQIDANGVGSYVVPRTTTIQEIQTDSEDIGGDEEPERVRDGPFYTSEQVTQMDEVAMGESVYLTYDVDGIGKSLYQDGTQATRFNPGARLDRQEGISLEIKHERGINPNRAGADIDLQDTEYGFDEQNSIIWFRIDTEQLRDYLNPQDGYEAELTIEEENNTALQLADREEISATVEFDMVADEINWGMDPVEVEPNADWTILGETPYAPTTDIDIVARSEDRMYPFLMVDDTEINNDGTITGTFDFQQVLLDTEFEILIRGITDEDDYQEVVVVEDAQLPEFDDIDQIDDRETVEMNTTIVDEETEESIETATVTIDGEETTITGGEGSVQVPQNSIIGIEVNADEYESENTQIQTEEEDFDQRFELNRLPEDELIEEYELTVSVQDSVTEEALSNATVSADGNEVGVTRDDGTLPVVVEEGDRTISVSLQGYEDAEQSVSVSQSRTINFSLDPQEDDENGDDDNGEEQPINGEEGEGEENGDDDDVRSPGQPGFGVIVTTLAIIGALLFARKRNN